MMHYACPVVQCGATEKLIITQGATGDESKVRCPDCKEWLRVYHEAFPKGQGR